MFTLKVNSKQKRMKKTQKRKNKSSNSTRGHAYRTHGRAAQCQATRTVRACTVHGHACLPAQTFHFFRFHRFAHKIQTVNRILIPFSPMRSLHLALSNST